MQLFIAGICGTFMGGLALLTRELGHEVSGCDRGVYPPMSTQLEQSGIRLMEGYEAEHLTPTPDLVIVGNALSRGLPIVEALLEKKIPYTSGPAWLADNLLSDRPTLAVAGTHGKTTTASMLAWILEYAGLEPGFLIGGVPENFGLSARAGKSDAPFVIEADEYDTAFFDKRPKFIHYRPDTLIINNIEFDHADIFDDLATIEKQFHYLLRTVPGNGRVIAPTDDPSVDRVLGMGCWTPTELIGTNWQLAPQTDDYSEFTVTTPDGETVAIRWSLIGEFNANNAVAAMAAAATVGTSPAMAAAALAEFKSVKRRLQLIGQPGDVSVYDDFAHHPSAIKATLTALRARTGTARLIAVMEPRSNTMRLGVHKNTLGPALDVADIAMIYQSEALDWSLETVTNALAGKGQIFDDIEGIVQKVADTAQSGDQIVIMSNGDFGGIHARILAALGQ